jgi:hypothetical protein
MQLICYFFLLLAVVFKTAVILITKAKQFKRMKRQPSLIFCILMDIVGYATYAIPFLGEIGDVLWAPISSMIFMASFGGWKGALGGVGNFIEELLPGTDFIPSFTIMWFIQNMQKKNTVTAIKTLR